MFCGIFGKIFLSIVYSGLPRAVAGGGISTRSSYRFSEMLRIPQGWRVGSHVVSPVLTKNVFFLLLQVSPAKFAWLVHSVGVALASLSPISSWVGLQIGYTNAVLDALGISPPLDGFLVVLRSLPYRFFPVFYLLLILIVLVSGRDFGPMASAEDCGANTSATGSNSNEDGEGGGGGGEGGITPKAGTPLRSRNALIPFATVIAVTFAGMILDGISKIEAGGNEVSMAITLREPGVGESRATPIVACG